MKNINTVLLALLSSLFCLVSGAPSTSSNEKPLLLLVSFDGFRWDYLKKYNLSNFNYLKSIGSHAEYIQNSFATLTFPSKLDLKLCHNIFFSFSFINVYLKLNSVSKTCGKILKYKNIIK